MQEWKTENGYISTKQIREANFFLSGLLVSRGTTGNQTWKAFSIREGGWILQDRERVRNSIDLHRFTPLYTRSDRHFPRESFLCILAQGEEGERGAEEKISSLFHHFCPICSINIVRIAGIVFWNFNREGGGNKTYRFDRSITKNSWENRNWTYNFPP